MDKDSNSLLRIQKILFYACWAIIILLYCLDKCLDHPLLGTVEPKSSGEYIFQVICVLYTLFTIPFAVKFFPSIIVKNYKKQNVNEPITCFQSLTIIQISLFFCAAFFCELAYSLSLNMSCGICVLMIMCSTFFCYPSEHRLQDFIESFNNDKNQ